MQPLALIFVLCGLLISSTEAAGQFVRQKQPSRGLPVKVVQERLGHSSITLTMDRYGHLFPRGDDTKEPNAAELALVKA